MNGSRLCILLTLLLAMGCGGNEAQSVSETDTAQQATPDVAVANDSGAAADTSTPPKEEDTTSDTASPSDVDPPLGEDAGQAPVTDTETPDEVDTETPDETDSETPDEADTSIPDTADTETPDEADTSIPDVADTETPDETDTNVPGVPDTETPDETDAETPDETDAGTPDETDTGMPSVIDAGTSPNDDASGPKAGQLSTPVDVNLLPPPMARLRRRMNLDQLQATLLKITQLDSWFVGSSNLFETYAQPLGRPDYESSVREELDAGLLFDKVLGDAARTLCPKLMEKEEKASIEDRVFITEAALTDTFESAPQKIKNNLQNLIMLYHGRFVPTDSAELSPWITLFETATNDSQPPNPVDAWSVVCTTLLIHPDFFSY